MKKILILFLIPFIIFSCQNDEYEAPSEFTSLAWRSNFGNWRDTLLHRTDRGNYVAFTDFSTGAVEHSWIIQEGDEIITGLNIPRNEYTQEFKESLKQFINNPGATVTNEHAIGVVCNNVPTTTVKLLNVFNDSVAFESSEGVISTVFDEERGKWVIEKDFTVYVYDTIVANHTIEKDGVVYAASDVSADGSAAEISGFEVLEIEAGETVDFVEKSNVEISRPSTRTLSIFDVNDLNTPFQSYTENLSLLPPESDIIRSHTFTNLGEFVTRLSFTRQVDRDNNLFVGDNEIYRAPVLIRVKKSTTPITVQGDVSSSLENGSIPLTFNAGFESLDANIVSSFKVDVDGTDNPVQSVEISPTDPSVLIITTATPIYTTDSNVSVSFDASVELGSPSFENNVAAFTAPVITQRENILNNPALTEFSQTNWAIGGNAGHTTATSYEFENSIERAFVGSSSLKIKIDGENKAIRIVSANSGSNIQLEAGAAYRFSFKVYLESGTLDWILGPFLGSTPWWGVNTGDNFGMIPTGRWVEIVSNKVVSSGLDTGTMQLWVRSATDATFYVDDFQVAPAFLP
ncbi:hypothetical protein [Wenyingzhuangia sp. IMCC45574]